MSSFAAKFKLDGNEFSVLSCSYAFGQGVDAKGQPTTEVQGGNISLQIAASDDSSIIGWMIDPNGKKNGSIVFQRSDQDSTLKEVKFEEGYCVGYSETFNANSTMPMTISLNITAKKISVGDASLEKKWK
ncbi:MAG TPA: type VI secretion system tube protein TssD [Puia sp.]|nr:type VI secretion system tube protein TssD [Puia sp.]